jgi:glycosyltransferase-like protein
VIAARSRRRSVGLFTYSTLPRGSVVHTASLADALVDAGWDVTVYAIDKDGRGFFRPLRAELRLVPAAPAPSSTADLVRLRARELARYLLRHGGFHDIHHAEDCLSANGLLLARAQGRRLELVRTVHHVERFEDAYLSDCQSRSIRQADLCMTVSRATRRDVRETYGIDSVVIGNGVDSARFRDVDSERVAAWRGRLGSDGPLVLAMGGVEPRKNTLRILRAFAGFRAHHRNARLWILGGATVLDHGAYRATFDRALDLLPSETRAAVTEVGIVADEDISAVFRIADVLAMPSLQEGFGLGALEALAAGLPVVVSDAPPFTEFLDESCATLVDPLSDQAITDGLLRGLTAAPARRHEGRRRAEILSWGQVAALHISEYERTLVDARDALHCSLA